MFNWGEPDYNWQMVKNWEGLGTRLASLTVGIITSVMIIIAGAQTYIHACVCMSVCLRPYTENSK